jgi:hypothetical protein
MRPHAANDKANEIVANTSGRAGDEAAVSVSAFGVDRSNSGRPTIMLGIG